MGIQRVGHVVFKVRDLEVSKKFYTEGLGMQIASETPAAIFFSFGTYHHDVAIFKVADDAGLPRDEDAGMMHVALIADSLEELVNIRHRLEAQGYEIAAQFDHGFTLSLYLWDPDHNQIEIYAEVPEFDWKNTEDYTKRLIPIDLEEVLAASKA